MNYEELKQMFGQVIEFESFKVYFLVIDKSNSSMFPSLSYFLFFYFL